MKEKPDSAILFDATEYRKAMDIIDFVEQYSSYYYNSTSRWIESRIEEYLTSNVLTEEDFLRILAWKTDRINQKKSEYEGKFIFKVEKEEESTMWIVKDKTATAKTQYTTFDAKMLYSFFNTAKKLRNEYIGLKGKFENGIIKPETFNTEKANILRKLNSDSPDGIGSVYLITFFYFVTNGDEPIFDKYAMMALDAIYPDEDQIDSYLGTVVKPRYLPNKTENSFDNLLAIGKKEKTYQIYKKKLEWFVNELNEKRKQIGMKTINCAFDRSIDRALWVYGHFFRENE